MEKLHFLIQKVKNFENSIKKLHRLFLNKLGHLVSNTSIQFFYLLSNLFSQNRIKEI